MKTHISHSIGLQTQTVCTRCSRALPAAAYAVTHYTLLNSFRDPGKPEKIKQVNRSITASPPRRSNSESSHCMPRLQAVQTFSVYRPTADDQLSGGGRCASRGRELGTADLVVRLVASLRSLPGDARPILRTTVLNSRLVPRLLGRKSRTTHARVLRNELDRASPRANNRQRQHTRSDTHLGFCSIVSHAQEQGKGRVS